MSNRIAQWLEDPEEDERLLGSSVALIEFARSSSELHRDHPRRLVSEAVWFWTERGSPSRKYKIRYRTPSALRLQATLGMTAASKHLAHEHVHQRQAVIEHLLEDGTDVRAALQSAQACVVTREEHVRLERFKHLHGWVRYLEAGIAPLDLSTGSEVDLLALITADRIAWGH